MASKYYISPNSMPGYNLKGHRGKLKPGRNKYNKDEISEQALYRLVHDMPPDEPLSEEVRRVLQSDDDEFSEDDE